MEKINSSEKMEFKYKNASSGEVAIVTGANSGIGFYTALGLAKAGYTLVLACRNKQKALKAKLAIEKEVTGASIHFIHLDLADLASVKCFAQQFIDRFKRLDVLVENAGIMMPPKQFTVDGFESQLGVNFLGHFVLTKHLLSVLSKSPSARVVSLSSVAHKKGRINFSDLQSEKKYKKFSVYAQSKLACFMFGYELHRRLSDKKLNIQSVIAHPGGSDTELGRHLPSFWYRLFLPIIWLFTHTPKRAANPSLLAALGSEIRGGDFVGPLGFLELQGKPGLVQAAKHAYSFKTAQKLWSTAEQLTGEKFEI